MVVRSWSGVLAERDFRLFFSGYLTSFFGSQMVPVAVTFAVLNNGGTAADVGYVLAAETVPLVVFLLVGGVIADRLPRRVVMIGADLLRAVSQGTLAVLLLTGHPICGSSWCCWPSPARASVLHPGHDRADPAGGQRGPVAAGQRAHGPAQSAGTVVGPATGGVLVATVGPGWAIAVDAATYLVSAYCLARVPVPLVRRRAGRRSWPNYGWGGGSFGPGPGCGGGHQRGRLAPAVLAPFMVLGAVVAKQMLGGAGAWGARSWRPRGRAVAGGLVMLRVRPRRPLVAGEAMLLARAPRRALSGLQSSPGGAWPCRRSWPAGRPSPCSRVVVGAPPCSGSSSPDQFCPRVSAYDWFGSLAFLPIGYAIVGPLAGLLSITGTLWLAVAWSVLTTVGVLVVPGVWRLRAPAPSAPELPAPAPAPEPT